MHSDILAISILLKLDIFIYLMEYSDTNPVKLIMTRLFCGIWSNTTYLLLFLWKTSEFVVSSTQVIMTYWDQSMPTVEQVFLLLGIPVAYTLPPTSFFTQERKYFGSETPCGFTVFVCIKQPQCAHNVKVTVGR